MEWNWRSQNQQKKSQETILFQILDKTRKSSPHKSTFKMLRSSSDKSGLEIISSSQRNSHMTISCQILVKIKILLILKQVKWHHQLCLITNGTLILKPFNLIKISIKVSFLSPILSAQAPDASNTAILIKLNPPRSQETTLCQTLEKIQIWLEPWTVCPLLKICRSISSWWELQNQEQNTTTKPKTLFMITIQSLTKMLSPLNKTSKKLKSHSERLSLYSLNHHLTQSAPVQDASNTTIQINLSHQRFQETTSFQTLEKIQIWPELWIV